MIPKRTLLLLVVLMASAFTHPDARKLVPLDPEKLDMYHNIWSKEHTFPVIKPEMALKPESLN